MEAQLQRPSHGHEEDPHEKAGSHSVVVGEGEEEQKQHGEKKSVLKKVKDKAKKIKDTIKHHSLGHEHEHEGVRRREENYRQGYEEEDEDGDDDEAVANDPEIHGAPIYESTVIRSVNLPRETYTNLEKPTDSRKERYEHDVTDQGISRSFATGPKVPEFEMPPAVEKPNVDETNIKLAPQMRLEEDPRSPNNTPSPIPPSNYQSKLTDPTGAGGKEADVAPLVRRFDNLNVYDAPVSKPESEQRPYSGSHDQSTSQPTSTKNQFNQESNPVAKPENTESNPKIQDSARTEDMSQDTIAGKASSAASAVADKAVSAKNMVVSKLGYSGDHHQESQDSSKKPISESASEYAHKVAETLAPVYEKVAGAGSAVMSKVHGSGGAHEHQGVDTTAALKGTNNMSMKEYLSEKFRPGAEDKALSEAITNALHKKKEATGEEQVVGKVTESEEVAARLGSAAENKREGDDALASGKESSGQGVVDRMKNAVGLWLGKSNGMQTAQDSVGRSYVSDTGSGNSSGDGHVEEVNVEKGN